MIVRAVLARPTLVVLIIVLSIFFGASTWAAKVLLAWDPNPNDAVAGYEVCYGLSSGNYIWTNDAGANTSMKVFGLTSGLTYYFAVLAYDSIGDESPFSNEIIYGVPIASSAGGGVTSSVIHQSIAVPATNATSLVAPELSITLLGQQVMLSWPQSAGPYYLQGTPNLAAPSNWMNITNVPVATNGQYTVVLPASGPMEIFRLILQTNNSASAPVLEYSVSGQQIVLSWSSTAGNYQLESTASLAPTATWVPVTNAYVLGGGQYTVTLPMTGPQQFFQLCGQ